MNKSIKEIDLTNDEIITTAEHCRDNDCVDCPLQDVIGCSEALYGLMLKVVYELKKSSCKIGRNLGSKSRIEPRTNQEKFKKLE